MRITPQAGQQGITPVERAGGGADQAHHGEGGGTAPQRPQPQGEGLAGTDRRQGPGDGPLDRAGCDRAERRCPRGAANRLQGAAARRALTPQQAGSLEDLQLDQGFHHKQGGPAHRHQRRRRAAAGVGDPGGDHADGDAGGIRPSG